MGKLGAGLVAISLLIATGATTAEGSAHATNGAFVFTSQVGAHSQVFSVNIDGSGLKQLTHFTNSDSVNASWSPDARRIAFERDFANHAGIYTMNAGGGGLKSLTPKSWPFESVPSYSPSGKQIVFNRDNGTRDEIWVMTVSGKARRQVTPTNSKGSQDRVEDHPRFSPDGKEIIFVNESNSRRAIFIVNSNGTGLKRLTPYSLGAFGRADWSPDGSTVVFSSGPGGGGNGSSNVYTSHPDGSDLTQLTHETDAAINDSAQSWSPDGTQIAFIRYASSAGGDLYVMNADGSGLKQVTTGVEVHGGSWGAQP